MSLVMPSQLHVALEDMENFFGFCLHKGEIFCKNQTLPGQVSCCLFGGA